MHWISDKTHLSTTEEVAVTCSSVSLCESMRLLIRLHLGISMTLSLKVACLRIAKRNLLSFHSKSLVVVLSD